MNVRVNLVSLKRFKIQMDTGTPARGCSGDEKAGGKKNDSEIKIQIVVKNLRIVAQRWIFSEGHLLRLHLVYFNLQWSEIQKI